MNRIVFVLKSGMRDTSVADLQEALRHLFKRQIERMAPRARHALEKEHAEQFFGEATQLLVREFQRLQRLRVNGEVNRATAKALNDLLDMDEATTKPTPAADPPNTTDATSYSVDGDVRLADGSPAPGTRICAFDQDLRSEQRLGDATTDAAGRYVIHYQARAFDAVEGGGADLFIRAYDAAGAVLATSPTLFNAPAEAELDLTIPSQNWLPPTLIEKVRAAVTPLLGKLAVEDLDEDARHQDLTFLSGETGFSKPILARFVLAHRLAEQAVQTEFWFAQLGRSVFQYSDASSLRKQLVTVLAALSTIDETAARKALIGSFSDGDIPLALQAKTDSWIKAFIAFNAQRAVGDKGAPTFAGQALAHAGIATAAKQNKFALLLNQYKTMTPQLVAALEADKSFSAKEVADLRTTYRLADLTDGDFTVVKMLKEEFDVRRPEQIRTLAKKSPAEWSDLITRQAKKGAINLPISLRGPNDRMRLPEAALYGAQLERKFRETYPTAAFQGGLERALANGGAKGLTHGADLQKFLDDHADFELLNTSVDKYFDSGLKPRFRALAQKDGFRTEVKAVQRVFKVTPTFEASHALLADGVHSAQMIYRMGQSEFVERYAGPAKMSQDDARKAWNKAADTHAAVITVVGDLQAYEQGALPMAMQNDSSALANFPNWNNLFQSGDLCDCETCRSVLGPAAYFADLLMFLKDRKASDPAFTVKDVLFARRPDLGFIELDCDNAMTPLPYVDVVCEVLENVVADGAGDYELAGFTAVPAAAAAARAAVAAALAGAPIALGADFSLTQIDPADPDRWVVHGDDATYLLKKKSPNPNFFAVILPNTKASAEELRAYPAYVNKVVYDTILPAQRYPFALPFSLYGEEVKAAFDKCHLQRWDLMGVLHGAAAPNNAADGDIAAAYFGIAADPALPFDEKRLILVADAASQQALWGETGNAGWLATVANVKTFLAKTGLEYNDLLTLIDLKYINPNGDIRIDNLDPTCDTAQKTIANLDAVKLDRIHRFLRLWRKLAVWKMWEVDLVLRLPAIAPQGLDQTFLINLFHFSRLRTRLGAKVTVEQVCGLLGDLSTDTHFTEMYKKRGEGFYQGLFLNKRHVQPLDHAFDVDKVGLPAPTAEKIPDHMLTVLAALGVRQADFDVFAGLIRATDGTPYVTDDMTLDNLSILWRQAWLSKQLKLKAADWRTLLKILHQDCVVFTTPKAAMDFVETVDRVTASGFKIDELNWLLTADRSALAAPREADTARVLLQLRKDLQAIQAQYDPAQYPFLDPPADPDALSALLATLLPQLRRDETGAQFFIATLRNEVTIELNVPGLPAAYDFPAAIKNLIAIGYDASTATLRFTGLMTPLERQTLLTDATLNAVTAIPAYQDAIAEIFRRPRLALKFYEPVFTAPLATLPTDVDFKTLADPELAGKISFDAENLLLQFVGVLTPDEKRALEALNPSNDAPYRNAVNSLHTQPTLGVFPPEAIWLQDADLVLPLRDLNDPANDHLAANLATAVTRALAHLTRTSLERLVVQQTAAQTGLSESLALSLLTQYPVMPATLLTHLSQVLPATSGAVDYATLQPTFDGWYWAGRVARLWTRWGFTPDDLTRFVGLTTSGQLLDFLTLPLNAAATFTLFDRFLRASRLMRVRDALPEPGVTLLEVLAKLNGGGYATPADFGADVNRLNDDWSAADAAALTSTLDVAYPAGYLLAETWERVRNAFNFLDKLNASTDTVKAFAAVTMTDKEASTVKNLLHSKFGSETWLSLSGEIQDALRERKRTALAAYLLTRPMPADAPSGKWENTNDLYAYYLLDVEMCSCMLTSRLVQASGSVQLFVQRCFMGLEPQVAVKPDEANGSAWRWWTWMRKYRVWEANRKVFLWPENWIEPELKQDRSSFFKELENDLQQNDINADNVETAFTSYLTKLDGVAQLQIAGFFQEDDGDNTILHVFGRTKGTEPHLYYYRTFDYVQWSPWEKVDLDIQGDYLVPAVVAKRLYLFWPVFTEVQDEQGNSTTSTPNLNQANVPIQKTSKRLQVQMAVSDYRQGKWTPKRISKDFKESDSYDVELVRKNYRFFAVDRSAIDGRFGVKFDGYSAARNGDLRAHLSGAFDVTGCSGVPELTTLHGDFVFAVRPETSSTGDYTTFLRWVELAARTEQPPQNDFTLESEMSTTLAGLRFKQILAQTPGLFTDTPAWQLSYLDNLFANGSLVAPQWNEQRLPMGSWLPYFYNDKKRSYFVLPALGGATRDVDTGAKTAGGARAYYPQVKAQFQKWSDQFAAAIHANIDGWDLSQMPTADRQALEAFMFSQFPLENAPPYNDDQLKDLLARYFMRFVQYFLGLIAQFMFQFVQFDFRTFYHPFVCDFLKLLYDPLQGIPGLMKRDVQLKDSGFSFQQTYQPTFWVVDPFDQALYPHEDVDFLPTGAYASYNWELFYHAPLLIANALSGNQRFEEARDWYHYIFNPIGVGNPFPGGPPTSKYWITKPFYQTGDAQYLQQRIDTIMRMLAGDSVVPDPSGDLKAALEGQVLDWRNHPFDPHRIANYRNVAYQKTAFMKYLDNLIAWGDNLFAQDSMESINEATQLYILAAELLGPKPRKIPPQAKPPVESFNELENQFDSFSNALVEVENVIPPMNGNGNNGPNSAQLPMLYFCIPNNEKLLGYWDTVADRLYKIRNCMNIEGVVRQLSLFEPPIDPGALVKAVAGGVDIASALADLNAPLPLYRFNVLLQKANEVCADVRALGGALLSALEKKDGEALALLRQSQEIRVLQAALGVRQSQLDEATENLAGIRLGRAVTEFKKQYYGSREFINTGEAVALALNTASTAIDAGIAIGYALAGGLKLIPDFVLGASGFGGSPHAVVETGGSSFGDSADDMVKTLESITRALDKMAAISSTMGSYQRRKEEWDFQHDMADKELAQIDSQIASANLRIAIAEKELANQSLQIDSAKAVDEFMHAKYTNKDLYQWHVSQISGVYFRSYKLAYDLAKRAERCFRFELGLQDSNFIKFGYWDSLKKGLLSGEQLQFDLRRMEAAYLEQNKRELELTKHVSLALLDPAALVMLKETGRCVMRLPEEIFDLDYPGHYFRRIKSVSLTLPCVTGPYTTISCTLRLLKNSIRINTGSGDNGYPRNADEDGRPADDARFVENNIPTKSIAASSAQNDSGTFELNFRDERYLPFEGAGAISEWSVELFNDLPSNNPDPANLDYGRPLRQFDYDTISDAILHVKYSAREDAGQFKNQAISHLRDYFVADSATPSMQMFNLRRDFPSEWARFVSPAAPANGNVFTLEMAPKLFRLLDADKTLTVNKIYLLARCTNDGDYHMTLTPPLPAGPPADNTVTLTKLDAYGGLHVNLNDVSASPVTIEPTAPPVTWQLKMTGAGGNLQPGEVEDVILILGYEWG